MHFIFASHASFQYLAVFRNMSNTQNYSSDDGEIIEGVW
jgi:hypothetical protein